MRTTTSIVAAGDGNVSIESPHTTLDIASLSSKGQLAPAAQTVCMPPRTAKTMLTMMAAACADSEGRCRESWLVLMGPRIRTAHSQVIRDDPDRVYRRLDSPASGGPEFRSQHQACGKAVRLAATPFSDESARADPGRLESAQPGRSDPAWSDTFGLK